MLVVPRSSVHSAVDRRWRESYADAPRTPRRGDITPVVARTFGLGAVAEAMQCMQDETILGRLVIVP